ncbi:MAG: DNA polymerase Y family protein, partial [Planctomycetota bacterium]
MATDHGVRLGMPIAGAVDVLARCHPSVLPHDREADRLALTSLAFRFQSTLCPRVSLEVLERFKWSGRHRHDPECLVFDLQGVTHLFGAETDLLAAAARVLSGQGYRGRFGIADTL